MVYWFHHRVINEKPIYLSCFPHFKAETYMRDRTGFEKKIFLKKSSNGSFLSLLG